MPTADLWEYNTQSFLIRLWIEEPATETAPATWRGHITHIAPGGGPPVERAGNPGVGAPAEFAPGERRYVQDLAEISEFLAAFLREMGAST